jgi:hypothetical protein
MGLAVGELPTIVRPARYPLLWQAATPLSLTVVPGASAATWL